MSTPLRWDEVPRFEDPLDVAEALLDCGEADATWAALIDRRDDTPACVALRASMADRCRAWELCAKRIEHVALGHLVHRQWHLVRQFSDWGSHPRAGAAGAVYHTAAGWLAAALLRLEETSSRGSADDEP